MKLKIVGTCEGVAIKKNGLSTIKFKSSILELADCIKTLQTIQHEVVIGVKYKDEDDKEISIKIGKMMFDNLAIDKHGECVLRFLSDENSHDFSRINEICEKEIDIYIIDKLIKEEGQSD